MNKVIEIKQMIGDSKLLKDIDSIINLTEDIVKSIEIKNDLYLEDYKYICTITERAKIALQKVLEIIKV